jgi:hypothetical protein
MKSLKNNMLLVIELSEKLIEFLPASGLSPALNSLLVFSLLWLVFGKVSVLVSSVCKQQFSLFSHSLQTPDFVFSLLRYVVQ